MVRARIVAALMDCIVREFVDVSDTLPSGVPAPINPNKLILAASAVRLIGPFVTPLRFIEPLPALRFTFALVPNDGIDPSVSVVHWEQKVISPPAVLIEMPLPAKKKV